MAQVANLILRLSSDGTGLSSGIKKAQSQLTGLYRVVSGGFLAYQAKRVIDYGSKIVDLSKKMTASTDAVQSWQFAAEQSGATIDDVATAFKKLKQAMVEAVGSNGSSMLFSFEQLGVTLEDIRTKQPEQLFEQIARKVQQTGADVNVTTGLLKVMGRSADSLIPPMVDGFADAAEQARELGLVLDNETLAALDEAGDSAAQLATRLITVLAPAVKATVWEIRNMVDFLRIFSNIALENYKMVMGLKSASQAGKDAGAFTNKVIDQRIRDDSALAEAARRLANPVASPAPIGDPGRARSAKPGAHVSPFSGGNAIASDQLAKIGLFRGGTSETVPLMRRMVSKQDQTVTELRGIRSELAEEED